MGMGWGGGEGQLAFWTEDHICARAESLKDASGGDQGGLGKAPFMDPHETGLEN